MLVNNMTLKQMSEFKPSEEDMAMLPLDVVLYIKVVAVSATKEDNYDIIRYFFNSPDLKNYLKDFNKTAVYDFNVSEDRFVTIFELYGNKNYMETSEYFKELLETYEGNGEVLFNFFTHDDKEYLLSNLDGIVKMEQLYV